MVKLFKGMAERGAILALVVPKNLRIWLEKFSAIKPRIITIHILGTGSGASDLFAVSSLRLGCFLLSIILGASAVFWQIIFILQCKREKAHSGASFYRGIFHNRISYGFCSVKKV